MADAAAGPGLRYAGPRRVSGRSTLHAQVRRGSARTVAVTFLLDGEPLGTDTTPPFALDVEAGLLPPGRHRLRLAAVDALGGRVQSRAVRVQVGAPSRGILTATPHAGPRRGAGRARRRARHRASAARPLRARARRARQRRAARRRGSGHGAGRPPAARWSLVTVRGRGVRVSDLAIDGRGRAERGIGIASGSQDVRVQRVGIHGVTRTGVEVWGRHSDISIQDSVIAGAGAAGAGVFELGSDASRAMSVIRTTISGFRSHGIDFAQRAVRPAARRPPRPRARQPHQPDRRPGGRQRHPRGRDLVRRRRGGDHRQPHPRHRLGRHPDRGLVHANDGGRQRHRAHARGDLSRARDERLADRAQRDRRRRDRHQRRSGATTAPARARTRSRRNTVRRPARPGSSSTWRATGTGSRTTWSSAAAARPSSCRARRTTS